MAEPVGWLWAGSASSLLLAGGIENLSSGFGQNYVLFPSKFIVLVSISQAGASGAERRSLEVDADTGPCEYLGASRAPVASVVGGRGRGTRSGVTVGC